MSKYFTVEELIESDTAKEKKIKNIPPHQHISNIEQLIDEILHPMRVAWTEYCDEKNLGTGAIQVNSGYRCSLLNKIVGGSKNSLHKKGFAADIEPVNNQMKEFQDWVSDWIKDKKFDKLIFEKPRCGIASWIHVQLYGNNNEQRQLIFTLV